MDASILKVFEDSLGRCNTVPEFLDRFYDKFLASSPKVRAKFAHTDFARQKRALRDSFRIMLQAAENEATGPELYLRNLAEKHSSRDLNIGAEFYDLWLDSLLASVRECDPEYSSQVERAWESVMMVGINYLLSRYK
jgi:hemoglobin-like flavoprotein